MDLRTLVPNLRTCTQRMFGRKNTAQGITVAWEAMAKKENHADTTDHLFSKKSISIRDEEGHHIAVMNVYFSLAREICGIH